MIIQRATDTIVFIVILFNYQTLITKVVIEIVSDLKFGFINIFYKGGFFKRGQFQGELRWSLKATY